MTVLGKLITNKQLPDFASQWVEQWKQAGPRLQAIRDEELRRLDQTSDRGQQSERVPRQTQVSRIVFDRYPERHGMVMMQRWFMRRHLLQQSDSHLKNL